MSTATDPARRRKVPRKTVIGVVALVAALVAGGVAYAIYAITARVTGTATTLTLGYEWVVAAGVASSGGPGTTCDVQVPDPTRLDIGITGYPGDTCTFSGTLRSTGAEPARLTGTALTGLPSGWSAEIVPGSCGREVPAGNGAFVQFKVTVGPSGSGTIGGGLLLSPKSQTGGATSTVACTPQTAP